MKAQEREVVKKRVDAAKTKTKKRVMASVEKAGEWVGNRPDNRRGRRI